MHFRLVNNVWRQSVVTLHACVSLTRWLVAFLTPIKGPEEQLLLFGEVSPDMLRFSSYQDEETAVRRLPRRHNETPAPMEMDPLFDMDVLMSEFSDTLFSTLASHQNIAWPNPREIGEKMVHLLYGTDGSFQSWLGNVVVLVFTVGTTGVPSPRRFTPNSTCRERRHDPTRTHPSTTQPGLHGLF